MRVTGVESGFRPLAAAREPQSRESGFQPQPRDQNRDQDRHIRIGFSASFPSHHITSVISTSGCSLCLHNHGSTY